MKPLPGKKDAFVREYFQSQNGSDAARKAGYSPKVAATKAMLLLREPAVIARLQDLRNKLDETTIAEVQERKELLSQVARHDIETKVSARDKVIAIDVMNKMGGDYPPEKHAVLGDVLVEVIYRNEGKD